MSLQLNTRTAELAIVRIATYRWLRKHGMRLPAGPLTDQQEMEIEECFEMLDEDGSGALDTDELVKAFNLLGFKVGSSRVLVLFPPKPRRANSPHCGLLSVGVAQACSRFLAKTVTSSVLVRQILPKDICLVCRLINSW